MISKTAQADVEDMWEAGLKPTFADIIRLNAVALKVQQLKSGFALAELPRVAFLGGVVFHEPTIGSEMWFTSAQRLFDTDDEETFIILRSYSLSMPEDKLPDPVDEKAVRAGIQNFKDSLSFATLPQILAATGYVIHGFKHDACENATPRKDDADDKLVDETLNCYEVGLLRQGMTYRIGTAADLCKLQPRVLQEMITQAMSRDHIVDVRKDAVSMAEDDYLRTLDEITARLKGESNG